MKKKKLLPRIVVNIIIKKNAEYEISRKANNIDKQIRAYALVYRIYDTRSPKRLESARL